MVISIWCGSGKSVLNEVLEPFVHELNLLLQTGVQINEFLITVKVKAFICDTLARSYIKGILNENIVYEEMFFSNFLFENSRYH